jgi:MFS family permease
MKNLSFPRILIITLLGFALTFSSNIQDPPLMTFKVRQLAPDLPNTTLGILGFIGLLVAMAVQPIVGVFSDRARTKLGRRLPFIIGGAVLIAAALFLLAAAPSLWVLVVGVIFIQFASNILQGPWQALIPDLVPEGQRGAASSLKAALDIIALVGGGAVAGMILGEGGIARWGEMAVFVAAGVPVVIFAIFVTLTAIWAREQPGAASPAVAERSVGQALKNAFAVDFRQHPIFGWWFANRILFWAAFIAINSFLINYLVDVIRMTQAEAQSFYGTMKIILGVSLVLLALGAGWLSDRVGRKPVMLAAGVVAFVGVFALLFVRDRNLIVLGGAVVGMGVGAFLAASWALATDIVPRDEAARYLGIANIATCIGSGGARLLGGVMIDPLNAAFHSTSAGYLTLFALAALFFLASTLVLIPLPNRK